MKKKILIVTYTTLIYAIVLIAMLSSCSSPSSKRAKATEVISDNSIIIEKLNDGHIGSGVHKIKIDSSEYILVSRLQGVCIIKHK
tara:strand:- start:6394 stop:6648 length:255 start_codon:yes stop_codon:yes gene_type:complete